jgi:hypothetical protein
MSDRFDRPHVGYVLRLVFGTVILWATAGILATFFDPHWPDEDRRWYNFLLFAFVLEFLLIKTYRMIDNTIIWKRLGASLIAVNIAFSILYGVVLFLSLFPQFAQNEWLLRVVRGSLVGALAWSAYEVLRFPGEETRSRPWLTVGYVLVALALIAAFLWRVGVLESLWYDYVGEHGCDPSMIDDPDCVVTSP